MHIFFLERQYTKNKTMQFKNKIFIFCLLLFMKVNSIHCFIMLKMKSNLNFNEKKKAPLVIGHEIENLKKIIKSRKNNLIFINYKLTNYNVQNMKKIYQHSNELCIAQKIIHKKEITPIINFELKKRRNSFEKQYHMECQMINILRGFVHGRYELDERNFQYINNQSIPFFNTCDTILKDVYDIDLGPYEEVYLKSNNLMYQKKLKKFDSYFKKSYDCSRHLIHIEDIHLKKSIRYLNEIENPVAVQISGKVNITKLVETIEKIKEKHIILIFSFISLISMKKQLKKFITILSKNHSNNIIFCMCLKQKGCQYTVERMEKDLDFLYKITNEENINFGGISLNFELDEKNSRIV